MSKLWIVVIAAVVVIGAGLFVARGFAADESAMPQVGQQAPSFTLNSQEGKPVSLDSFRGKWVVLYFYPKDMTQGCTIEAHNFQRDLSKYEAMNAVIVGVSVGCIFGNEYLVSRPDHLCGRVSGNLQIVVVRMEVLCHRLV